ncbi:MAG: DUF4832 domain-containing protein [Bacteroidota bacterium]
MNDNRRNFLKITGIAGLGIAGSGIISGYASDILVGNLYLSEINYEGSMEVISNPERGFFPQLAVNSEREGLDVIKLKAFRTENMTMILRIFYLEKFKDKPLSEAQLSLMRNDMQKLRDAGMKCVIRLAYTNNMKVADAPLAIVEQHLDQLKPVFEEGKDVIAFVQCGLIGAWGEWHSSSNGLATTENQRKVLFKLLSVLPTEIMVQVRTPGQKQKIFDTTKPIDKSIAYKGSNLARTGHHNDCFLATDTDYGTYSKDNIQGEKQYISDEAFYVPTGGETCPPVPKENLPSCEFSIQTMKLLKWTYLHLNYYRPTINAWKASGCFEELQRDLGYRLSLLTSNLPSQIRANKDLDINIRIANKGYAPLYNYKITSLVLKNSASGKVHEIQIPVDMRECKPSGEILIDKRLKTSGIPKGTYDLSLKISDRDEKLRMRSEYSIRLANKEVWDESSGTNSLKHSLKIV